MCFAQPIASKKISLSYSKITVSEALLQVSKQAEIDIAFSDHFFKRKSTIEIHLTEVSVEEALKKILSKVDVEYEILEKRILIYKKQIPYYTLSGYIQDRYSGERLVAATVYNPTTHQSTISNDYGFYSLTLPAGDTELVFNYIGCEEKRLRLNLNQNSQKNIHLSSSVMLQEVIIRPQNENTPYSSDKNPSSLEINKNSIHLSPSVGGEADLVRKAQLSNGIQSGTDGLGGIFVRGGGSDQNLILLDGVPVYIPYHLLGLFSIYNQYTIRHAKIYKGSFPARYGGRLSSVFDVHTREGNQYKWTGMGSVNLVNLNAAVEGPIQKGKGSILVAGRSLHNGFLLNPFLKNTYFSADSENINTTFFDLNVKLNYILSQKDRLYLSFYHGRDKMQSVTQYPIIDDYLEEEALELDWSNSIIALRWNHLFSDKLFSNMTLTRIVYMHNYSTLNELIFSEEILEEYYYLDFYSNNKDIGIKWDFDYLPSSTHYIKFGVGISNQDFLSEVNNIDEQEILFEEIEDFELDDFDQFRESNGLLALQFYTYIEDHFSIHPKWEVNLGLRASSFLSLESNYFRLEPRLFITNKLTDKLSASASFSRMIQYLHLVSYANIRLPNDLWLASDKDLLPQESWQGEMGLAWEINSSNNKAI